MPVERTALRIVKWITDEHFDYQVPFASAPVFSNVEVVGSGENAYLSLVEKDDNEDNVPFTTPSNYIYDSDYVEITSGKALLKASVQNTKNYDYSTPSEYNYDSTYVEITGGIGKLVGSPVASYAWYHMNESSGTNVPDTSGNGRDGTTINMDDSNWVTGKLNNALTFNGTDEYVDTNFSVTWERTQPFSFEAWVKTSGSVVQAIISNFAKPGGQYRGHEIFINSTGTVRLYVFGNNLSRLGVESTNTVNDGSWHHIIGTYDGSSTPGGCHIYIDNNDETLTTLYNTLSSTVILSTNFHIGRRQDGIDLYFNGEIDEVVIYDVELDSTQVAQRWNSGSGTELPIDSYDDYAHGIETNVGFPFTFELGSFLETSTVPSGSGIKHQVSINDGTTYKFWNGSVWTDRTTSIFDLPDSINLITGTYVSGDIDSLQIVDADLYIIQEVVGVPGFDLEITFSEACAFPGTVTVYGYYNGNPAHTVDVDIYNYNTSSWDTLGVIPHIVTPTVTQYNFTITGTPSDYIDLDSKESKVRFYHTTSGVASHILGLDHVRTIGVPCDEYWYQNESNSESEINSNISSLPSTGTLRILSFLKSDAGLVTPELDNLRIEEGISYPTGEQEVEMNFDIEPTDIYSWLTITETSTKPANTSILYKYSVNSGTSYNNDWLTVSELETALQGISSPDKVRFKFQLDTNDGDYTPELDNVLVTSDAGFETSGYYISTGYYAEYSYTGGIFIQDGEIEKEIDLDNTISIKLREATRDIDLNFEYVEYPYDRPIELAGELIQWRADFIGNGSSSPKLKSVQFRFYNNVGLLEPLRFIKYR